MHYIGEWKFKVGKSYRTIIGINEIRRIQVEKRNLIEIYILIINFYY